MAATPLPTLGDVSCRATGYMIQQLQRMGLPTGHLTRGITTSLKELQSHATFIPWDDYLVFLQNSYTNLSADQFVELCTSYYGSPHIRPLLSAAGVWFHPCKYFQWVADPESGAIRQLFRCVRTRFTRVGEREVLIEEVINPGYALPPDLFWQTQSIGFGALTTSFGLGPSFVTWEPVDRGVVFRVRLPRRRPVRFVLSWLASWFRRDTAEDIRSALSYGHERSLRLEREIAERKTAEAARRESEERLRRISDAVPGIVYQYYLESDGRQGFLFASGGATGLTGFTPSELIARPEIIWAQIDPDDIPGVRQSILESARTGTPWEREFRFRTKDGECRWLRGRSIPEPVTGSGRVVWNGILTDVSAEKQADAQLRARDALLRKLSEQVPGVIYQYQQWPDGRSCFPYASNGIRDIYEVTPDEVRGSAATVFGRLHPDDLDAVAESIRRSLETLEPWGCEYRVVLPTRGTRWLDGHAAPERMPDGSTIWHGYIRDVTDRKLAEDSIRESETRFRTLIEDLDVGVVLINPDDRIDLSNSAACRILGLTHDQLHGVAARDPRWEIVRADDTPFPPEDIPFSVVARTRQPLLDVTVGARNQATGHRTWMQVNGTPRLNPDGSLRHVILTFVDVTDRRRAEAALRESEEQLRLSLRAAGQGLYDLDLRTGNAKVSPEYATMIGYDPATFRETNSSWADRLHPDDREKVYGTYEAYVRGELPQYEVEFRQRTRTGGWLWTLSMGGIVSRDPDGKPLRMLGTHTDISARKQAQAALEESEERLRLALAAGRMGTFDWDMTTDRVVWSDTHYELFGYPPGDRFPVEFRHFADRLHPDDRPAVERAIRQAMAARTGYTNESRIVLPDGTVRWVLGSGEFRYDPDGRPVRMLGTAIDITDRKLAEEEVRRARDTAEQALADLRAASTRAERFHQLCEAAGQGIGISRLDGGITYMNPAFRRMLEIPDADDVTRRAYWDLVPAESHQFLAETVLTRTRETGSWTGELDLLTLTDRRVPVINTVVLLRDPDGTVIGYSNIATDITEQKRAADALRASEEKIRAIVDGEPECVKLLDRGGHLLEMNPAGLRMIEADDLAHVRGAHVGGLVAPPDREAFGEMVAAVFRGESGSLVFQIEGLKGARRTLETHSVPMWDADRREVRALLGVTRDITEQKAAEQALVEEKSLLQAIFASLPGIAFAFDQRGRYVRWNHNYDKLLGYPDAEMARLTALDTIVPRDRERVAAVIRDVFALGESTTQLHALTKDGRELPLFCSGVRVTLGGQPCVLGFGIDISGRLRAEAALRESEERLRIFVESAPAGVAMLDRDVRYISYSRRWLADYGLGDQNLVGRSHYEVFPEVTDRWKEIHRRCLTGVSERCEQDRFERADGTVDYLRWEIQPWADATGAVGGLVFFTEMITDRVKAEEQVRASLREKEAMLKEIHHRVKNNLQVVSSLLSLQAARVTHPVATDVLAESQNRVRAMALVHETLYRSDDLARVDLSRYLGELCGYLFRSYGVDSARVRLELDVEPVSVSLDKTIPCGLLVNEIVSNSLKHAFPGARTGGVTVRAGTRPDGRLTLTLADDGVGLPAGVVVDQTPSLGLQLVNILTEQLGGHLAVERSPGTRFTVSFTP